MKASTVAATIMLCFLSATAHAQWREAGKVVPDTERSKSDGDLGAMLLLTDDPEGFFESWNKPPSPNYMPELATASSAGRGDTVVAVVIFTGCAANSDGNCVSEIDFKVLYPDGSLYAEHEKAELWKDKPAPPPRHLQVSVDTLGLKIEEDDPFGTYHLEAVVRDMVAKREIKLRQKLEVVDE